MVNDTPGLWHTYEVVLQEVYNNSEVLREVFWYNVLPLKPYNLFKSKRFPMTNIGNKLMSQRWAVVYGLENSIYICKDFAVTRLCPEDTLAQLDMIFDYKRLRFTVRPTVSKMGRVQMIKQSGVIDTSNMVSRVNQLIKLKKDLKLEFIPTFSNITGNTVFASKITT